MKTQTESKKVYWQPKMNDFGWVQNCPNVSIYSFQVWHSKKNLLAKLPNCIPVRYSGDDIEEPTFMD